MARPFTHAVLALLGATALARPSAAQDSPQQVDTVHVVARTDPTVVSATRSFEVLTRADLARHATRSLADVLGLALGVDAQPRSPAQADLALRGSTFNQVVVLVDGVRVSDVQSGHYALDLAVPMAMIERIEILRGTGSAMYGSDAIGGVVNIVTRADSRACVARHWACITLRRQRVSRCCASARIRTTCRCQMNEVRATRTGSRKSSRATCHDASSTPTSRSGWDSCATLCGSVMRRHSSSGVT